MSEFGTGYAYNLGLFLAHAGEAINLSTSLWFDAAAEHLFELKIPDSIPSEKREEIIKWREKCLALRFEKSGTRDEIWIAIGYAKQLLLDWDLACGVKAEKADWN